MAGNFITSVIMELVDRISGPLRRITQAMRDLGRRMGLDRLMGSARNVRNALGGVVGQVGALSGRLAVAGGSAAAAVWGVERLVSSVADMGNEVQIASERLGVGTGWLQEWMYAARQYGVDNDALIDGFKELSLRTDEFVQTGAGGAAESFQRLGISVQDLRKTAGDTGEILDLVMSRMSGIKNDSMRQRIFDEVFGGTGGEQMVELLTRSRDELDGLRQSARDSGAIISDDEIEQGRSYTRLMGDLRGMIASIQRAVVGALLPAINDWLGRMRELTAANREAITDAVLSRIRELWEGMQAVGRWTSWAADRVGGFSRLALIAAGVLAIPLIGALAAAGTAILTFSTVLLTTPVGWLLLAVGAIAGAVYLIYRNWDGIAGWFAARWQQVQDAFSGGLGAIGRLLIDWSPIGLLYRGISAALGALGVEVPGQFASLGGLIIDGLIGGLVSAWQGVTGWLSESAGAVVDALSGVSLVETGRGWIGGLWGAVTTEWSTVSRWFGRLPGVVRDASGAVSLTDTGRGWIGGLWDGITGAWHRVTSWLSESVGAVVDTLSGVSLVETGRGWIGGLWGAVTTEWGTVSRWLGRLPGVVRDASGAVSLTDTGRGWIGGLWDGITGAWHRVTSWLSAIPGVISESFGTVSLLETGHKWIGGLWDGIAERWEGMSRWLSDKLGSLTSWMPDWMTGGIGVGSLNVPAASGPPALGPPAIAEGGSTIAAGRQQTDVGGELRIRIDSEGRPRVASMQRNGAMDYSVETGLLGVVP